MKLKSLWMSWVWILFLNTAWAASPTRLTFILTNDLHGNLEPHPAKNGREVGGLATLAAYTASLRQSEPYASGQAGLFVLDSGDQFQGTLLSNFDEGRSMFLAMNEVGYHAVVPGNHDYDFGPIGWLYDRVQPGTTSDNPLEVIESLARIAKFPLVSANTYYKASIRPVGSMASVPLSSSCVPTDRSLSQPLDFKNAKRPEFLKPYQIVTQAGVKVALIGLDNKNTASTTTAENVEDLCFRDELETYLEIREELEGQADVFVLLIHHGDSSNSNETSELTKKINSRYPHGVDLVAAGHTHAIHLIDVHGVKVVQDGAEAKNFGRVDLFFDPVHKTLLTEQTKAAAGQPIDALECGRSFAGDNAFLCQEYPTPLLDHSGVKYIIDALQIQIAPMAKRKIVTLDSRLTRHRTDESSMSNALTDALRSATNTEISFMNTGGIRTDLPAGEITYEQFFAVLPFANRVAIIPEMKWGLIQRLLLKSAQTCGRYGALMFSGLKVEYKRNCAPGTDVDLDAKLVRVNHNNGELLLDAVSGFEVSRDRIFKVATLDFLASGGSGFAEFKEAKVGSVLGIARETIADEWASKETRLTGDLDQRFKRVQ